LEAAELANERLFLGNEAHSDHLVPCRAPLEGGDPALRWSANVFRHGTPEKLRRLNSAPRALLLRFVEPSA